jgi:hypothetical protein
MALNSHQSNFISDSAQIAKKLLDLEGQLDQLNVLWAGSPNYKAGIIQADIDLIPGFTGLTTSAAGTVGTLPDAEFAMANILTTIKGALVALTVLARSGG